MKIQVFLKISVLKNVTNFSGKHLRWETTSSFIKKRLQQKCFPVKFLRAPFSTEQLRWLLFKISNSNNLFKDISAIYLQPISYTQSISDNPKLSQ